MRKVTAINENKKFWKNVEFMSGAVVYNNNISQILMGQVAYCSFKHFLVLLSSVKFALFIRKNYADVIKYNSHILESFDSLDWLKIFYSVRLRLILKYSTMFEGLANSSKIVVNPQHVFLVTKSRETKL